MAQRKQDPSQHKVRKCGHVLSHARSHGAGLYMSLHNVLIFLWCHGVLLKHKSPRSSKAAPQHAVPEPPQCFTMRHSLLFYFVNTWLTKNILICHLSIWHSPRNILPCQHAFYQTPGFLVGGVFFHGAYCLKSTYGANWTPLFFHHSLFLGQFSSWLQSHGP